MQKPRLFALVLVLLAPFQLAQAILVSDLPNQLQSCIGSNNCFVDTSSPAFSLGTLEAYSYVNDPSGSAVPGFALRYILLPPSGQVTTGSATTPYMDYVWLTVQNSYALAGDSNRVTVYTDKANPQPTNLLFGDSNGLDIDIDMTNAALLAGSGSETNGLDSNNNPFSLGDMNLLADMGGGALLPCAAAGCTASARLNLIYLNYVDSGSGTATLAFNAADTRALLYQVISDDNGSDSGSSINTTQSYYVAVVPLPAAAWLFASGLLCLTGFMRRVRNT
ncbi:MAG TPA: hypothetical protein ENI74_01000 [Gammaproteobacteria bacterium]|nr:hypothetical protein [Gammaproteobacteria bacterium]